LGDEVPAPESTTVTSESIPSNSVRGEFADSPDTTPYFEAWLESLRPSSKPIERPAASAQFSFEGTLSLDGRATGTVRSQAGTLIVAQTAEVQGDIVVATAIVEGLVRGDIRATVRVELGRAARVIGNIETPALAIQPGAVFEGQCHFLPPPRHADGEAAAQSSVEDAKVSKASPRRARSKPDQHGETEAMAVAAGR
jgi:cytoskeletal protein CcmA (bactofilin family)